MTFINKATIEGYGRIGLMLLVLLAAIAPCAFASNKPKTEDLTATVVAHTPLPSAPGGQMLLLRKGSKQYLYIQQASRQGYMIVEVTKANEPNVLKSTAPSNQATAGNLELVSPDVAIAEAPEGNSAPVNNVARPTKSVRVLDLSDPANPRTVQTFDGVTGVLQDSGRIYLMNEEGLWILEYSRNQKRQVPLCDSESVFSPIVDCQ
jgi:hypothetical protein